MIIGGLITILYAITNYWSQMSQNIRVLATGLALALVIGFVLRYYPRFLKGKF